MQISFFYDLDYGNNLLLHDPKVNMFIHQFFLTYKLTYPFPNQTIIGSFPTHTFVWRPYPYMYQLVFRLRRNQQVVYHSIY